jgi:hypothetical protein
MSGQDVHWALAVGVGVVGVVVAAVTIGWGRFGRPGRLAVDRAILVAMAAVLLAIGSGLLVLAAGGRPADALHFVYAAAALAALPIARFAGWFASRRALAVVVGALVVAALVVRLAQTG